MNYILSQLTDKENNVAYLDDDASKAIDGVDHTTNLGSNVDISKFKVLGEDGGLNGKYFVPDSAVSYYSTDGTYVEGSTSGVVPATVAGQNIGATAASSSTGALDSLNAATDGLIKINDTQMSTKFKVVGFQKSYGKAQG
ncbi:hypothetical protein Zmor_004450 [Zophobas morio]|uniref:Uncharacterized protein n=1 Tax=Zophobas morio TaxID=2755281 RepID=A0AA38HJ39_9CUCU|nr:hypothetical protein Zmor_004450 [Zophobas morio]